MADAGALLDGNAPVPTSEQGPRRKPVGASLYKRKLLEMFPPLPSSPPPSPPLQPPPPRPPIAAHDTIFQLTGVAKAAVASSLQSTSSPTETAIVSGTPVYGNQGFMEFDGADDKVVIGARQLGGAFTIAAWIRWSQNPTLWRSGIGVAEVRPPSDSEWGYRTWVQWFVEDVTSSSPACSIQMRHNVEGGDHDYRAGTCTSTSMYHPDGEWHHYAITVETTTWSTVSPISSVKMYADGVLQDTCDSIAKRFEHDTWEVSVGYAEYAGRFTGGMANFRVYPSAIDVAAIKTIASTEVFPPLPSSPPPLPPPFPPPPRPPIASHDTIFMLTGDAKAVVASTLPSTSTPTETAIVSGSPVYGSQGFMDFDGADDKVVIGARQPGGAFTIAAWIRWSQNPTLGQIGIGVAEVRPPSDSEWGYRTWVQWFIEDVTSSSPACNIQMRHNVEGGDHAYRARTCTSTSMYHPDGE